VPALADRYPHVIAGVTGGGADDFFTPQYDGVAPELDAVTRDAHLVTMTSGGNDSGVFINSVLQCGTTGVLAAGR
jgi:hypothetical protein